MAETIHIDTSSNQRSRIFYFEWLRCFAAMSVVMIHVMSGIMDNHTIAEIGLGRALAWSELQVAALRWAVPVFFMITGALLLEPNKFVDWKKVKHYIMRMLIVLCTWGLAFCIIQRVFIERSLSIGVLFDSLIDLASNKGFSHLWYVYALIGIYLLLPIFRAWVCIADANDQAILLSILFVFTCTVPTINAALDIELSTFVWLTSSSFYVLLGYYAHCRMDCNGTVLLIGFTSLLICMLLKAYGIAVVGEYWKWLHSPSCPLEAAWSLCIFLLAKRFLDCPYQRLGIDRVANYSFGIYVLHPLFLNFMYKALGWGPWSLPPFIFEMSMWTLSFLGALGTTAMVRKMPIIKNTL